MAWKVELSPGAQKAIKKFDPQIAKRLLSFLHTRLAIMDDPRALGESLTGSEFGEYWKYRVGDYRIIANIHDNTLTITVIKIGHRREVYREH